MKLNAAIAICLGLFSYFSIHYFVFQSRLNNAVLSFSFEDLKGETRHISDFKNKIVILNFWASWCAPCRKEFPDLLNIANTYPNDVVLIALSSDIYKENIHQFLSDYKIEGHNVLISHDENSIITDGIFSIKNLPVTLILDQKGEQRYRFDGYKWQKDVIQAYINDMVSME